MEFLVSLTFTFLVAFGINKLLFRLGYTPENNIYINGNYEEEIQL